MIDESIIPECFVDTNLIETLVPPQTRYNHQKGCGTVAKVMKERFADRFAVGIIDKDKFVLDYLSEFTEVFTSDSLILHKHNTKHHYIIKICPAMERFILANAAAANIGLEDFELPSDLALLKKESKKTISKNDDRFKRLFTSLNTAPDFRRLSSWINYLKDNNYNADLAILRAM